MMRHTTLTMFIITLLLGLAGCSEEWIGHVYPNKNQLVIDIGLGKFDSLEECRRSALRVIELAEWETESDYECGLNCKVGPKPYLCEVTAR